MKYSIVVPCYNEEGNIKDLVKEFCKVKETCSKNEFELILVNNGSKDNTESEIDESVVQYDFIKKVNIEINQGYGYGILQGMSVCQGEYIGWIHADLQFSPLLFVKLFRFIDSKKLGNNSKVYFKGLRKNRPFVDKMFTFGMSCFETVYLKAWLWDINAQPTLMKRELYDYAKNPPFGFSLDLYFYYMASKMNYKILRFNSPQKKREVGKSSWNTGLSSRIKLIKRNINDSKLMKNSL